MQKAMKEGIAKNIIGNILGIKKLVGTPVEQKEILIGTIQNYGDFIQIIPPTKIVGVILDKKNLERSEFYQGSFIHGRTVKLSPYYLGKYVVTYFLWKKVYDWAIDHGYDFSAGQKGSHGDGRNKLTDPVTKVSWLDCIVWCNAYTQMTKGLSQCVYFDKDTAQVIKSVKGLDVNKIEYKKERKGYRLPTEAEWEYAARFNGDDPSNSLRYGSEYLLKPDQISGGAWCAENSGGQTHPVGQNTANKAGFCDMCGNVWEWCYDSWEYFLPKETETNPSGIDEGFCDLRVTRGGGWHINADQCILGLRFSHNCSDQSPGMGFRVAYSR